MNKLTYIKYSQKEANQKIWDSLMDKYKPLKKRNTLLAYLWFPFACILFGFVAIFSWFSFLALLFKDVQFTPHYLKTTIETSGMSQDGIIQYLDLQYSRYKAKLSFGNIPLAKQKQIEATFDILYTQYELPESDEKHEEIISNFTALQQSVGTTNQDIQVIGKGINFLSSQAKEQNNKLNSDLSDIKQQTISISQYTDRKLGEEKEFEKRKAEKEKKESSKYNREKGRNLDSFESALSDGQVSILTKYCNEIPVFKIDITQKDMKEILLCTHTRPLQTTVNKYLALLFTRLCEEKLICVTWKSVAMNEKCFISPKGKELTSKDLSSANSTSGFIKPHIYNLIEDCIEKIKDE